MFGNAKKAAQQVRKDWKDTPIYATNRATGKREALRGGASQIRKALGKGGTHS